MKLTNITKPDTRKHCVLGVVTKHLEIKLDAEKKEYYFNFCSNVIKQANVTGCKIEFFSDSSQEVSFM